jgi:hypothetical protein
MQVLKKRNIRFMLKRLFKQGYGVKSSVADPDHFDADPDPIMLYFVTRYFCFKMDY